MTMPTGERTGAEGPIARNLTTMVTAVRWGTTTVGLLYAATLGPDSIVAVMLGVVLLAYALLRTFKPVRTDLFDGNDVHPRRAAAALAEVALDIVVVASTGCWESPYVFVLFTPVLAAGFARGFKASLAIAAIIATSIEATAIALDLDIARETVLAFTGELLLLACVAGYSNHLLSRATERRDDHMETLTQAHRLLVNLNQLSDDLPASFDFGETVETAMREIRTRFDTELTVLLLANQTDDAWTVAYTHGARLAPALGTDDLPKALRQHVTNPSSNPLTSLGPGDGLASASRTGIYVSLFADPTRVGLLALESPHELSLGPDRLRSLRELADQTALTIDNARWFEKLRARGAAQERYRIARDLHDRVGQGVAYVAFELERLVGEPGDISDDLSRLTSDAKQIVGELRETLYDLRTEVTGEHDLSATIVAFAERVRSRSGLSVDVDIPESMSLSIPQQKEVWRIVQEAMLNAERHANAERIRLGVESDQYGTRIVIDDDGTGIPDAAAAGSAGPGHASYGITGMRERAALLGARLTISQRSPNGTRVDLNLGKTVAKHGDEEFTAGETDD